MTPLGIQKSTVYPGAGDPTRDDLPRDRRPAPHAVNPVVPASHGPGIHALSAKWNGYTGVVSEHFMVQH